VLNGWNLSGVSTYQSGTPIRIGFNQGDLSNADLARAWFGTGDNLGFGGAGNGRITPTYSCDPTISGSSGTGDTVLDIGCIGIPAFGETGPLRPPFYLRSPDRMFHDLTVFKNFRIGTGDKKLQFRVGLFNLFNMAFADPNQNDIDRNIETTCNVQRDGIPDGEGGTADGVCDPEGGFSFTQNTLNNFGNILSLRGHRVIEFALKFFF
jgi:hypothetical protein